MTTSGEPTTRTLTAATVSTFNFQNNYSRIEVLSVDGAAEVWFTTDGTAPTVGGASCHVLPATMCSVEVPDDTAGQNSVVKVISSGTPKVSVRGV